MHTPTTLSRSTPLLGTTAVLSAKLYMLINTEYMSTKAIFILGTASTNRLIHYVPSNQMIAAGYVQINPNPSAITTRALLRLVSPLEMKSHRLHAPAYALTCDRHSVRPHSHRPSLLTPAHGHSSMNLSHIFIKVASKLARSWSKAASIQAASVQ